MLCFVVVMQSFIMNSHEVFIHIHQGCFAGTGAIVRLPQCQWSKPDGYGKISQCITTTKHSKAKTVCIFLGIYCTSIALSMCTFAGDMQGTRVAQSPPVQVNKWAPGRRRSYGNSHKTSDERSTRITNVMLCYSYDFRSNISATRQ